MLLLTTTQGHVATHAVIILSQSSLSTVPPSKPKTSSSVLTMSWLSRSATALGAVTTLLLQAHLAQAVVTPGARSLTIDELNGLLATETKKEFGYVSPFSTQVSLQGSIRLMINIILTFSQMVRRRSRRAHRTMEKRRCLRVEQGRQSRGIQRSEIPLRHLSYGRKHIGVQKEACHCECTQLHHTRHSFANNLQFSGLLLRLWTTFGESCREHNWRRVYRPAGLALVEVHGNVGRCPSSTASGIFYYNPRS